MPKINKKSAPSKAKPKSFDVRVKNNPTYGSARWKLIRKVKFNRNPVCECCKKRKGYYVDHIIPINQGGAVFDFANLQTLCVKCNAAKTGKDAQLYIAKVRNVSLRQVMFAENYDAWKICCAVYGLNPLGVKEEEFSLSDRIDISVKQYKSWGILRA